MPAADAGVAHQEVQPDGEAERGEDVDDLDELQAKIAELDQVLGEGAYREALRPVVCRPVDQRAEDDGDADAGDDRSQQPGVALAQGVERQAIDRYADQPGADHTHQQRRYERPVKRLDAVQRDQRAPGREHAMRHVEDAQRGEDEPEAEGEDRIGRSQRQAVQQLLQEERHSPSPGLTDQPSQRGARAAATSPTTRAPREGPLTGSRGFGSRRRSRP